MTESKTNSFDAALETMRGIMNTEEQRQKTMGNDVTETQLINHLSNVLETYEDANIRPVPKNIAQYL